jgi:manganese-dependent inorganic pyrophosphatase
MNEAGISKIPVVDCNKKLLGILSMKDIAKAEFTGKYDDVNTIYSNIIETMSGEEILRFDDEIQGRLIVAGYKSTTILENITMDENTILIVGNRHSIIEHAVKSGIKLIIVTGGHDIKEEHLKIAMDNQVNIIRTPYDTLTSTKMFNLANKVCCVFNNEKILCINENEDVKEFVNIANKTRYSYYPVLNKSDKCMGILRLSDVVFDNKKKVILVDHNSYEQSAIGLDETDILEIVDHHNIGSIGTNMPISFRNMPVGSTNTIISILYKENGIEIPKDMAGLMLSGILSDTLVLTSPTVTDYDKEAVKMLSDIAGVNYKKYGMDMLKAGSSLKGKTKEEVLYTDYKTYPVGDYKIGLGQITTLNVDEILDEKDEYIKLLNDTAEANGYHFVALFVTDIIKNGSYVLYSNRAEDILRGAYKDNNLTEGTFLKGVVSRKKQVLPCIMLEMGQ